MSPLPWLWIPLTVYAAFAQTVRNTAQRRLVDELGTLGATLVRFLFGLPFVLLWFVGLVTVGGLGRPAYSADFAGWVLVAALSQTAGTAFLLRAMAARSFAVGLVFSKSEIVQVAVFSALFLGERLSLLALLAIALATAGVVLLSPRAGPRPAGAGWFDAAALFGIASGAAFAISVVGYRGANLSLEGTSPFVAAAATSFWSQLLQTLLLGSWLLARTPRVLAGLVREWRLSLFAGFAGASASLANVTALALAPATLVRTLILVEVLFTYAVSLRVFREKISRRELAGIVLVVAGVGIIVSTAR